MKKILHRPLLAFALVAVVAIAAVAYAAPPPAQDLYRWVKAGLFIGSDSANTPGNAITDSRATFISWDFPACTGAGWTGVTLCHNHTVAFAVPGARLKQNCSVTSDHGIADGGLPDSAFFDCSIIATDQVVVREHYSATDAGVWDAPDSGYSIRTFSNQ